MARRALRPCNVPGCPEIAAKGGRCANHAAERARQYSQSRPSPIQQGYDYKWRKLSAAFLKRFPWCMAPGCTERAQHVDHIIPLKEGGTSEPDNLQALCRAHHSQRHAMRGDRWGRGTKVGDKA